MKSFAMILALVSPAILLAQQGPATNSSPKPAVSYPSSAFGVTQPDEGSPFFAERQSAKFNTSQEGQELLAGEGVAVFPKSKGSPDSATTIFTKFFTEMFASVKLWHVRPEKTTQSLSVEPSQFSLAERRELDATYTVRNNTKRLMRLDFNTTQRIDIQTTNPSGKVIEKWSDDHAFQFGEGVIFINPKERIEYSEKVATREMKPSETYTIKADMIGYPDYTATVPVTPSP
jgi:Intracellular proteinase inhibitor